MPSVRSLERALGVATAPGSATPRSRSGAALRSVLAVAFLLASCGSDENETPSTQPIAEPSPPRPRRCGTDQAWAGGEVLETDDGARLYHRVAGPADAPVVLYLHGGPGGNALSFERSVGERLEASLRVVYLDQRGCGRSSGGSQDLALGMDPTIADLERLRTALGVTRWSVIGHSFGGLMALVYASRHPDVIERLVLVEGTVDPHAALQHQVEVLAEGGTPQMAAIAASESPPFDRMMGLYQMLGRAEVSRRLHWVDPAAQRRAEGWEHTARLTNCTRDAVLASYRAGGWTETHPELMQRGAHPTLYVAGRRSHVFGEPAVERMAETLGAELRWLEESGHFPFVEEPEAFATAVIGFVQGAEAPAESEPPRAPEPRERRSPRRRP